MQKAVVILTATLAMFFSVLSVSHASYIPQLPPGYVEEAKKEPPLTQEDIDNFVPFWKEIMSDSKSEYSEAEAEALYKKHGFTLVRGTLVSMKVITGKALASVPAEHLPMVKGIVLQQINPVGIPTDAEIALIAKNAATLDKLQNMPSLGNDQ